jgi:DNA-binding transcriptional ArsR family regulator
LSVRDERLPPFAWVALDALDRVKDGLPDTRQPGARNALLALAESASRRRDGRHERGDTLRELAAAARLSPKRMRDHLRDLEQLGLVRIEENQDRFGRDLPTKYALLDGTDVSSHRGDSTADKTSPEPSPPTRARETGKEREQELSRVSADALKVVEVLAQSKQLAPANPIGIDHHLKAHPHVDPVSAAHETVAAACAADWRTRDATAAFGHILRRLSSDPAAPKRKLTSAEMVARWEEREAERARRQREDDERRAERRRLEAEAAAAAVREAA